MDSPFTIRVVDDVEGMSALEDAWNALAPPDCKPMRQYAWMRSIAESFCEPGELRVYVCERDGRVEAIAPLVQRQSPPRLEVLGLKETGEPPDVPFGTPQGMEHLAHALANMGIPFLHERLPAHSPAFGALRGAFAGRGWVRVVPTDPTPAIDLDATWVDADTHFNSGRRSDLRRMRRRAEKGGPVSFEVIVPESTEQLERLLDEAWTVEAAGWKGERGSALSADARLGGFYRAYARRAWQHGILRLAFMRIGARAVAMQLVVECDRRWWLLKIGYDERHASCAPGTLLLVHTIEHAARRGLAAYEFLGNPDRWSMQWARTLRHSVAIKAYPFSLAALPALRTDAMRALKMRFSRGAKPMGVYLPGFHEGVEILEVLRFVPI